MIRSEFQSISIVIIGLNVQAYIKDCISSILTVNYPLESIEIIYVDGGSNDNSVSIAESFKGVKVIELKDPHPTPGKGRNAGYRAAHHELIQFLDADTTLDPEWFNNALPFLTERNGAVKGKVIEKHPRKNGYHLIGDIEWNISAGKEGWKFSDGPCKTFGGIVLIRKDALEMVDGYDEELIAGEDPDISYRVRQNGWIIYQIDRDMVTHDLNMNNFKQYLKRAYRSGHAYAEIGLRYINKEEKYFLQQLTRILIGVTLPITVIVLCSILDISLIGILLSLLIIIRPLIKIILLKNKLKLSIFNALLYGCHLSFVPYPQFLGVLRYLFTQVSGIPLQNRGYQKA